jgi:hypothetical protein
VEGINILILHIHEQIQNHPRIAAVRATVQAAMRAAWWNMGQHDYTDQHNPPGLYVEGDAIQRNPCRLTLRS